jgi:S-DNA-T family DNA segregation ATPase FtsK/SpoIIIE
MPDDTFNPADALYANLDKAPSDFAAAFSAGVSKAAPVAGNLMADPDDAGGQDPANPVPATDPGAYELQPDSAVTAPEEAAPAPSTEPTQPAPAAEPVDLAPVFTQALEDYNAAAQAAQEAAQTLADLQNNAEGIAEFTPEMADAMEAKMKAAAAAEKAFEEIGDDSLELAMSQYPELRDDNHPATLAVKSLLAVNPEFASTSPTAVAEYAANLAAQMRANAPKSPAVPVSQPQPAPGPVPAKAPAAPASSSVAMAQRPAPGQPATPDIVAQVKAAVTAEGGLAGLFGSVLGNRSNAIRMS